jgi:hypothetical protein
MERQEASGVIQVIRRSPVNGTGFGAVAAGAVPPTATRPHKEIDDK